jgi:hypothetical protein
MSHQPQPHTVLEAVCAKPTTRVEALLDELCVEHRLLPASDDRQRRLLSRLKIWTLLYMLFLSTRARIRAPSIGTRASHSRTCLGMALR